MQISLEIDDNGLKERLSKATPETKRKAWAKMRTVSFAMAERVKMWLLLSVDTGRARSSWGIWTNDLVKPNPDASSEDAVYIEDEANMKITQGTNVEYVLDLEEGSSQRMPGGGISVAAQVAADLIVKEIGELLDEVI
jgi:hypothetical protein